MYVHTNFFYTVAEKLEEAEDQMDHTFLESSHLEKEVSNFIESLETILCFLIIIGLR